MTRKLHTLGFRIKRNRPWAVHHFGDPISSTNSSFMVLR